MRPFSVSSLCCAAVWILLTQGAANAQIGPPLNCSLAASPTIVYAVDPAPTGDMTLRCTGGQAGVPVSINLGTFFNTFVRVPSPPALTIDNGAAIAPTSVGVNSITWSGVPFTMPGPSAVRVLRFTNAFADTSLMTPGGEVVRFLSITGEAQPPINNAQMVVARVVGASFPTPTAEPAPDRDNGPEPFMCAASAQPPLLRGEGTTELLGDVLIECTGGVPVAPGGAIPRSDLLITTSVPLTSRDFAAGASEVVLLIDEPAPASQRPCAVTSAPCLAPSGSAPNVIQGERVGGDGVRFRGVPIDAPGSGQARRMRIKNVRANVAGAGFQIQASVAAAGTTSLPLNNTTFNVGFVQTSLTTSVSPGPDFGPCDASAITTIGALTLTEGFSSAWKARGAGSAAPANVDVGVESGFANDALGLGTLGRADHGTRLAVVATNVPAGMRIFAEGVATRSDGSIVAELTGGGGGPQSAPQSGLVEVSVSAGTATAYYEIVGANAAAIETASVRLYAASTGDFDADTDVAVRGRYAPSSAEGALDLPRFAAGTIAAARLVTATAPVIPAQCDQPGETYLHVAITTNLGPRYATCWAVFPEVGAATLECAKDGQGRLILDEGEPLCLDVDQ